MNLKTALLATAAGALLFLAACGGGGDGGSGNSSGNTGSGGDTGSGSGSGGSGSGGSGTSTSCQPQTVVGGDLFVAQQGPVGVTLLSSGVMTAYTFSFLYDNVFGIPTNNRQDKWGDVLLFPPGTPVGTSTQVQLHPYPFVNGEQTPSTFPKGIPLELSLIINDGNQAGPANHSSTASLGKDIPHDSWHTASVTYGANNTATVTFFSNVSSNGFSVALTNVFGKGLPAGSGSGC